ncbi:MAG: bifunctional hydroxymethylpyrimidine kinase/phosphomethylpyrimidine kinase [Kiritimatiellae bacterium]|nr:bifunctional hydroxymethylpyrimidine kinase/phosphomethylpyrimidine kinase [Kiritimatiellia bacterium]
MEIKPCCLTIAGSDSGGNAGVQADLRAFHSYGLHGCTVFAALTAQNPRGVFAVHPVPPGFVAAQLDAVLGVYEIKALKTGMIADAAVVETVAEKLAQWPDIAKVVDPVMVATSGAKLSGGEAVEALKSTLLPLATVATPNIPEAEVLSGMRIENRDGVREAAKRMHGEFGCAVLVKGGHATGAAGEAEDTLFDGREFFSFRLPWIENPVSTHGTGCTLAAALAAELALGRTLAEAVVGAKKHVHKAIAASFPAGGDCGVLGFVRN